MQKVDCVNTEHHNWEEIINSQEVPQQETQKTQIKEIIRINTNNSVELTRNNHQSTTSPNEIKTTNTEVARTEITTQLPGQESPRPEEEAELNSTAHPSGQEIPRLVEEEFITAQASGQERQDWKEAGFQFIDQSTGQSPPRAKEAELSSEAHPSWQDKQQIVEKLLNNDCCGQEISQELGRNCEGCGPGITHWDTKYSLVGSDVKALYPSIQSESTGKIIRTRIEKTRLEFEGFSQEKALAYVAMNLDLTTDIQEIEHLLPTRKSGKNSKLKISAIKQDWDPRDKFEFKNEPISYQDRKKIIARVVEIATRALFENHAYKFGNEHFKQEKGGSIGDRWTGCASELVMQSWSEEYEKILTRSNVEVLLLSGYVDDGRQVTSSLPLGSRFNKNEKMFQFSEAAELEDKKLQVRGESNNQRMARITQEAMNSVNMDLEFTVESPEDFEGEKLPTLDFKVWQEEDQSLNHTYYQKEMKSPLVIMARSGMAKQQKIQILANELTRRLSNIGKNCNIQEEQESVIEQFTREVRNSEYHHRTAQEIVVSGIRGYRTKITRRIASGQEFYRPAHRTVNQRTKKKLLSRENWYKQDQLKEQNSENYHRIGTGPPYKKGTKPKMEQQKEQNENKIKAVMFVPYTEGSELARKLRENEENINKITHNRVKIIERTGTKLQDLLTKSDPWKGTDCQRQNCLLCFTKNRTEKLRTQECHKRNVVYETRCLTCQEMEQEKIENMDIGEKEKLELKNKIKIYKYIGETSRSTFERGWEHLNDLAQLKTGSHMLKHVLLNHPDQDMEQVAFGMKILRTCKSSFERQIYESVAIQHERKEHHILNSRTEYNRCSIPRLSTQVGDKEFEKYSKELREEKEQEEKLEQMARKIRKERNKARLRPSKEPNQGTKRRKINDQEYITITEVWGAPEKSEQVKIKTREQPDAEPRSKRTKVDQEQEEQQGNYEITAPKCQKFKLEILEPELRNDNQQACRITKRKPANNEKLSNCQRIENKIIQGTPTNLEWEQPIDWEQMLQDRKSRLEQEERELKERLELQRKKTEGWELYRLCKNFLEQNDTRWNKRKEKEQMERERLGRLEIAMQKGTKRRINQLEQEQEKRITKLPHQIQQELELEQRKEERKELKRAKETLYKLRNAEKKITTTPEIEKIRKLEKKNEIVTKLLEQKKSELLEHERRIRTTINKKTVKNKNMKIDNEKKKKVLDEIWTVYRWTSEYLTQNNDQWEKDLEQYHKMEKIDLERWNKLTRKEKVEQIQQEQKDDQNIPRHRVIEIMEKNQNWKVWPRKTGTEIEKVTDKEQETTNLEQEREPEPEMTILEQPEQEECEESLKPKQEAELNKLAQPKELELPPPPNDGNNKNKQTSIKMFFNQKTRQENKKEAVESPLASKSTKTRRLNKRKRKNED